MPRRELDRPRVGLESLDQHAPRRIAAAAAGELGQELERPFVGSKVRHAERRVGVDDGRERDAREVVSLRDHLRAEQDGTLGLGEPAEGRRQFLGLLRRVRVEPDRNEPRHFSFPDSSHGLATAPRGCLRAADVGCIRRAEHELERGRFGAVVARSQISPRSRASCVQMSRTEDSARTTTP